MNDIYLVTLSVVLGFALCMGSCKEPQPTKTTLQTPPNKLEINRANMKAFSDIPAAGEYQERIE